MAEREPGLLDGDVEDLVEDAHLRDLHRDDGTDIVDEGGEVGRLMREDACNQIDPFALRIAAKCRRRLEGGTDDRGIDGMFEQFRAAADVADVVATKRDCCG